MKRTILPLMLLLIAAITFSACDSDDEDDRFVVCPTDNALVGRWQFVEELEGSRVDPLTRRTIPQPQAHVMEVQPFIGNTLMGKIIYTLSDGRTQECEYYIPEDQERYLTDLPAIVILDPRINHGGMPFGVEFANNQLLLHYLGIYTTDHVPETFVYKRIK